MSLYYLKPICLSRATPGIAASYIYLERHIFYIYFLATKMYHKSKNTNRNDVDVRVIITRKKE